MPRIVSASFMQMEDTDMRKTILDVKKELDQLDDFLNGDSILFKEKRWKVVFSENFRKSFRKLASSCLRKYVLTLLVKLASGWRPKRNNVELVCESSNQVVNQFKVAEGRYIVCTVDIQKEIIYTQVLKVWDILPLEEVPAFLRRLDALFLMYTYEFIGLCKAKYFEGDLEVPRTWKILCLVTHMLSNSHGEGVDVPFEVTNEEREIILSPKSSFILGRSGTGKTTVLTMKLFQNEQQHHCSIHGLNVSETMFCGQQTSFTTEKASRLFALGGSFWAESSFETDDLDGMTRFRDIPNSFIDIPCENYPLVITFHKFLMMLDGSVGSSYFDRFNLKWKPSKDKSLRAVAVETFIREKEINYGPFCCSYWPHFRSELTKNLDPSRVYIEIMSHIKGGERARDFHDGKLSRDAYVSMSKKRVSNLSDEKREGLYDIFLAYEKMKVKRGEFDVSDLVNDLHLRLKRHPLGGDKMDFVYIDEVQDLTMRQLSLFKYICRNVDEGFVFSCDTAQTIARGIDFWFADIRSLFYTEFVMDSKRIASRNDKGHLSGVFQLRQNFRTHSGGNSSGKIVGFGAEQVILVRDESAKQEIYGLVGQKALILTIVECKGLEFEDVLLYNFFSSSPLGSQWRVIYAFMKERGVADFSFPSFCDTRHNILCSELKQLYVAITRTRRRLWICESVDEFSRPMFNYWRNLSLMEVKNVDNSVTDTLQSFSTPEEWKSRGMKARTCLLEAAQIFYSIGRFKYAADCFYDVKDYKQAGTIYLDKCGDLIKAAECFLLAGHYKRAAELYAKGNYFKECLSACTKGKCYVLGLEYIENWKQCAGQRSYAGKIAVDIDEIGIEFLENCAANYFTFKDRESMMKFVNAFPTKEMKRRFLMSRKCLEELLLLEQESGNFAEAAEIARLNGDILREADLFGKVGDYDKAC
ncbi:hypothetical protein P3S68_003196 [Capsicum galapagoense]